MLKRLYLSPLGRLLTAPLKVFAALGTPFMVPGYRDKVSGKFRKLARISSSAALGDKNKIAVGDNVWIGHHAVIDGSNGVILGEGVQISYAAGIFTHGSHNAVRLYGDRYVHTDTDKRKGYVRASVEIGEYCFIGAGAIIRPGVNLGKGCLVAAGSVVTKSAPEFSILRGNPARVVGDVRAKDAEYMNDPELRATYFDQEAMAEWLERTG
jgi:acetyltransferase-like isoleucine patch superfamily enzyme